MPVEQGNGNFSLPNLHQSNRVEETDGDLRCASQGERPRIVDPFVVPHCPPASPVVRGVIIALFLTRSEHHHYHMDNPSCARGRLGSEVHATGEEHHDRPRTSVGTRLVTCHSQSAVIVTRVIRDLTEDRHDLCQLSCK